jgi:hypothetical protein
MVELPSTKQLLFPTLEGLYLAATTQGATSTPVGPRTPVQSAAIHRGGLIYAQDGFLRVCAGQTGIPTACLSRSAVPQEPLALVGTPTDPERFFALFPDGFYELLAAGANKLVNAPTALPPNSPNARNHELVLSSGSCVFFTDNTGSVISYDFKTNTPAPLLSVAPQKPVDGGFDAAPPAEFPTLGLAVDPEVAGDLESGYVYWTNYRSAADGGGVYRTKIPANCK